MCTNDTIAYIKHLAQDLAGCEPNYAVLVFLMDLGIPANYDGFEYLKTAVLIQYENPTLDIVNEIYEAVVSKYDNISRNVVATSIRNAAKIGWSRGNTQMWRIYLPTVPANRKSPPTNAELITGLARIVELWKGCADAYLRQQHREEVSSGRK